MSSLERCLQEPPPDTDRADILLQLGTAAQLIDMVKGATTLPQPWPPLLTQSAKQPSPKCSESYRVLIEQNNNVALVLGLLVFIAADVDNAISMLDVWVTAAHERGSLLAYGPATCFRGLAWLSRGALAEAEADIRDSMWTVEMSSQKIGRPFVGAYLANVLMEQGRLDEAAAALDWACISDPLPSTGYWYWYLDSRARLLMLQGQVKEGLEIMLACGRRFAAHGGQNPAFVAWRSGAALALFSLD